jgi:hypothetical protein
VSFQSEILIKKKIIINFRPLKKLRKIFCNFFTIPKPNPRICITHPVTEGRGLPPKFLKKKIKKIRRLNFFFKKKIKNIK